MSARCPRCKTGLVQTPSQRRAKACRLCLEVLRATGVPVPMADPRPRTDEHPSWRSSPPIQFNPPTKEGRGGSDKYERPHAFHTGQVVNK